MGAEVMRHAVWLLLLVAACAHEETKPLARPAFPEPRQNVFNTPVSVVESIDDDMMPTLAQSSGLIAYVSKQAGNLDIFAYNQTTGGERRLTTHTTDDSEPAFSPDGKHIAWISQADDVKGDVWLMKPDGEDKKKLTGRDTGESRPAWSADGKTLYFTAQARGVPEPRVEALELAHSARRIVVERAWDPAPALDASAIVYITADEGGEPHLYAKRFSDGRVVAITDGAYLDATPRFVLLNGTPTVIFTRFVDDTTNDGKTDTHDAPSIWSLAWDPAVFDGAPIAEARPLTPGGELLATAASNWIVYTATGFANLELYALPEDGLVARGAAPEVILKAARAEPDPAVRLLALRHVVAASSDGRGRARYELGRALEDLGRYNDARDELRRAIEELGDTSDGRVARLELIRVELLIDLHGEWALDVDSDRRRLDKAEAEVRGVAKVDSADAVRIRAATLVAEIDLARGQYVKALAVFETIPFEAGVSPEDGARSLDHATDIYVAFGDLAAVEHSCVELIRHFMAERQYVEQCSKSWIELATHAPQNNASAVLEDIVHRYPELGYIAARATFALGKEQEKAGHVGAALVSWQNAAHNYPRARSVIRDALMEIGETAERMGERDVAISAYEQLLAQFGSDVRVRGKARSGLTRIRIAKADKDEREGRLEDALRSYSEVIQKHPKSSLAHRRYIMLSARLGRLEEVVDAYAKAAKEHPREAMTRYAYGYALTFVRPIDLDAAEREVKAALDINPRLATAYLTLGWVYMQREYREPGRDWLDLAEARFRTAETLVNADDDPELWGAVQLNRANAFLELGKPDNAFRAYLGRIQRASRFDSPLTELLFYESFARAAWRMDELDVALDMAHQEWLLAGRLPGEPRKEVAAALQGALYLQAGLPDDAVTWFERAEALFRAREDWVRVVPMLRGKALALETLGRADDALAAFTELLDLTVRGVGVAPHHKSFFGFLSPEIPANPTDVTRAPYGFSSSIEEELSRAAASRTLLLRGDLRKARQYQDRRMALLAEAGKGDSERLEPELMHALNESALLAVREGDLPRAFREWSRAIDIGEKTSAWPETTTIFESLANVWTRAPQSLDPALVNRVTELATAMRAATAESDAETSKRLARWLAVRKLATIVTVRSPVHAEADIPKGLRTLDDLNAQLDEATGLVESDPRLAAHIAAYGGNTSGPGEPAEVATWRTAFDDALAEALVDRAPLDSARLARAIELFEENAAGRNAAERRLFLDSAVRALLDAGDVERAWSLLERERLAQFAPVGRRKKIRPLSKTSTLAKALDRIPAGLAAVREALEGDAVLVQAFANRDAEWTWFVIDANRLDVVTTPPMRDAELPAAVAERVKAPTVYVDLGELTEVPAHRLTVGGKPLPGALEALSATYLVAARDAFRVVHGDPVEFTGGTFTSFKTEVRDREFVHIAVRGVANEPGDVINGDVQVAFEAAPGTLDAETLDLDKIASFSMRDLIVWLDAVPTSPRVTRAITQALLIANVSGVIVGPANGEALRAGAEHESFATLAASASLGASTHAVGYRGRDFAGRVELAYGRLTAMEESAEANFAHAKETASPDDWKEARDDYRNLVSLLEFLVQPDALEVLDKSAEEGARAKELSAELFTDRDKLAQALVGMGEVDAAVKLREKTAKAYSDSGEQSKALEQQLAIGKVYLAEQRYEEAVAVLERCVTEARTLDLPVVEADCLSRLGSADRALYRFEDAKKAYLDAIAIEEHAENQVYPRRNLGLLYETGFNDYDAALEQYDLALGQARTRKMARIVPMILLDIARANRLRGDLGPANRSVREARAVIAETDRVNRTAAALEAANIAWYRGNFPKALDESREALKLAYTTGNVTHEIQATSLGGLVDLKQGDLREARDQIIDALSLARGAGLRHEEATQLVNLGNVIQREGDAAKAEEMYRDALRITTELGSVSGQVSCNYNLAVLMQEQKKFEDALGFADVASTSAQKIEDRYNESQVLFVRARALSSLKRWDEAREAFRGAHVLAVKMSLPEVQWRSLFALGRIERDNGHRSDARKLYDEALEVAERLSLAGADVRQDDGREALYADAVHLALLDDDAEAAFGLSERGLARNRLDLIDGSDVVFPSEEAKRLVEAARQSREAILTSQRRRLRRPDATDIPSDATLKKQHQDAVAELMRKYPGVGRAFTIAPVRLAELQKVVPDDTAVLVYTVGPKAGDVLVVRHSGVSHVDLPVTRKQLLPLVKDLREALRAFGPVEGASAEVAKVLVTPLEGALDGVERIVVVPPGSLVGVPFEALPWKGGLIVDAMATSYAPSASLLTDVLSRPSRGPVSRVSAVAYGEDLPFARLEALAVGGRGALVDQAATETAVRALRADAIDIAAHGDMSNDKPMSGFLTLAQGPRDDGRLELREIFGAPALAPLVSVSACTLGDDWTGWQALASAFFTAGTQTLVASESRISDLAAGVLMKRFYREHRAAGSQALRAAQQWTRRSFAHPGHWAELRLVGDFR